MSDEPSGKLKLWSIVHENPSDVWRTLVFAETQDEALAIAFGEDQEYAEPDTEYNGVTYSWLGDLSLYSCEEYPIQRGLVDCRVA